MSPLTPKSADQLASLAVEGKASAKNNQAADGLADHWVALHSELLRISGIRILTDVGTEYTREFLHNAVHDLEQMRHQFLVPQLELKPVVYVKATSNWLKLTMRYVVDPKKCRLQEAPTRHLYGSL